MTRESTLDEFLGGSDGDDAGDRTEASDGDDAGNGGDPAAADSDVPGDDLDPAPVTCEWTPGGAACEACGASVERRWVDGGARVCADCKEW